MQCSTCQSVAVNGLRVATGAWTNMASEPPTRQSSSATLYRGSSFLAEQREANKELTFDGLVAVSGLQNVEADKAHI